MFFTREDIEKIHQGLLKLGIKDSELPETINVNSDDTLAVVQDGKNKKINIEEFFNNISLFKKEGFINITDRFNKHSISLIEAIQTVPTHQRIDGLVITFEDINGDWRIYQFRGDAVDFFDENKWTDLYDYTNYIVKSITPDEEDLTVSKPNKNGNAIVSLKDRVYDESNFSGKGYKILRKNIQTIDGIRKNILISDMINKPNTIYEIRYDFDLQGKSISIGEGSILYFKGGSISNGTINSAIKIVSIDKYQIFNNIKFTVIQPCIGYAEWFGAKGDGIHNDYYAINNTIKSFVKTVLLCKTYFVESQEEKLFSFSSNTELEGTSSMSNVSKLLVSNNLGNTKSKVINISGSFVKITNILITKGTQPTSKQEGDYQNTAISVEGHNILLEEIKIIGFHTAIILNSYLTRLVGINCHHCYNGFYAKSDSSIMTSLFLLQCYAWQIANIGYYLYGYNYSQLTNCAGDQCTLTYHIESCINIQLSSCASEQSYRYLYIANSTTIFLNNLQLIVAGQNYLGTQEDYNHTITLSSNIGCTFVGLYIKVGSASKYIKDPLIAIDGYKNFQYTQYTFIGAYLDAGIPFQNCIKVYSGYTDYNAVSLINSSITSCDMTDLPTLPSSIRYLSIYVRDMGRNAYFNGNKWQDVDGFTFMRNKGDTSKRPIIEDPKDAGFEYYDTTLKKKIIWNGTEWTNMDGTTL